MAFTTRRSILSAVKRGDEIGWDEFYNNYKPLILLVGKDKNLTTTEKDELVQQVMVGFFMSKDVFVYDRTKGRFRDYLRKTIKNKAIDLIRKRRKEVSIESEQLEDEDFGVEYDHHWDSEYNKFVLEKALDELKTSITPQCYQIFHAVAIDKLPINEAVELFGKPANTIYGIKCRTVKKLRLILDDFDEC